MKFSLIHPSRGRPELAAEAAREWRRAASGEHAIEHFLSVDDDDLTLPRYEAIANAVDATLVVGPNRSLVEAANRAAQKAGGDVLIVLSDDFGCPKGWDASLSALLADRRDVAVLVDDSLGARILTLPIVGRGLFLKLGYIYHPDYDGLFVDDDLTETTRALGALIEARDLVFPHRHFTTGKASLDATYLRHNHPRKWWSGWRTFQKRRLRGFGVGASSPRRTLASARVDLYVGLRVAGSVVRQWGRSRLPPRWTNAEQRIRDKAVRGLSRLLKLIAPP